MTTPNPQDRLSPPQFSRLARFIEDYSGIKMPPVKKVMVEGRLRRRVGKLGLPSLDAYCDHLFDHGDLENEVIHLIDAVTTNKTEFFREPQHFQFLIDQGLPLLAKTGAGTSHPLKAWSAACSTGAEPYTLGHGFAEFRGGAPGISLLDPGHRYLHRCARKGVVGHLSRRYGGTGARLFPQALFPEIPRPDQAGGSGNPRIARPSSFRPP